MSTQNILKKLYLFVLISTSYIIPEAVSKSFLPCNFLTELSEVYNFSLEESKNLICIGQKLSNLNTNLIAGNNFGIFQINSFYCDNKDKCNTKCEELLDDDISDDVECVRKILSERGFSAWRFNKQRGCSKIFKNLDEICIKKSTKKNVSQCDTAKMLSSSNNLAKYDALIWACISENMDDERRKLNETFQIEARKLNDLTCDGNVNVECTIKKCKQTDTPSCDFKSWPAYELCKNFNEDDVEKCFYETDVVFPTGTVTSTKNSWKFTTSTEISILIEDYDENNTNKTESSTVKKLLMRNGVKGKSEYESFQSTDEGYSKVRVMKIEETTTSKNDDSITKKADTIRKSSTKESLTKSSSEKTNNITVAKDNISDNFTVQNHNLSDDKSSKVFAKSNDDLLFEDNDWFEEEIIENYELPSLYEKIDKCELARNIKESGIIPIELISLFLCIAENESQLNISLITTANGVSRFGLFQIDNSYFCNTNDKINECDVLCDHLLDDQFDNDFQCVRKILELEGLQYWSSYSKNCSNVINNTFDFCYISSTTTHRPFTLIKKEEDIISNIVTTPKVKNEIETTTRIDQSSYDEGVIKRFELCDLAQQLYLIQHVPLDDLGYFVCAADQSKLQIQFANESSTHIGLFNFKAETCGWIQDSGNCSIMCNDLLDLDIADDVRCFNEIYKKEGLEAFNLSIPRCFTYNSKILQCIDEEKFQVFIDDNEYHVNVNNYFDDTLGRENFEVEQTTDNQETTVRVNNPSQSDNSQFYFTNIFEIFTALKSKDENIH